MQVGEQSGLQSAMTSYKGMKKIDRDEQLINNKNQNQSINKLCMYIYICIYIHINTCTHIYIIIHILYSII